jgi:hypothetical protein
MVYKQGAKSYLAKKINYSWSEVKMSSFKNSNINISFTFTYMLINIIAQE